MKHRLEENVRAAEIELTADDLVEIEDVLSRIEVQGDRYSPDRQKLVGR